MPVAPQKDLDFDRELFGARGGGKRVSVSKQAAIQAITRVMELWPTIPPAAVFEFASAIEKLEPETQPAPTLSLSLERDPLAVSELLDDQQRERELYHRLVADIREASPAWRDVPLLDLPRVIAEALSASSPVVPRSGAQEPKWLEKAVQDVIAFIDRRTPAEWTPDVVRAVRNTLHTELAEHQRAEGETRWQPISEHTPQDDVIEMLGKRGEVTRGKWGDYRIHNVPGFVLWRPLPAVPAGGKP